MAGRKRKSPYSRTSYESAKPGNGTGSKGDAYTNLYASMTNSAVWHSLTGNQRELYRFCKSQWSAKQRPSDQYPLWEAVQDKAAFYMNWALGQTLGIYRSENTFYRDLRKLEETGLIECLLKKPRTGIKSVYRLSDKWWKKPPKN